MKTLQKHLNEKLDPEIFGKVYVKPFGYWGKPQEGCVEERKEGALYQFKDVVEILRVQLKDDKIYFIPQGDV